MARVGRTARAGPALVRETASRGDEPVRSTLRRSILVGAAIAALAAAFLSGYVVAARELPPYAQLHALEGAVRTLYYRMLGRGVSKPGRFKLAREPERRAGASPPEQEARLEELRAIGYVSGSAAPSGDTNVTLYDPAHAYDGLNLQTDGHRAQAQLLDMRGRELHSWQLPFEKAFPDSDLPPDAPGTAFWRRVALLPDGDLFAIYDGRGLVKIDRHSRLLWAYPHGAHHDLDVRPDGSIFVLTRKAEIVPRFNEKEPILHDFITVLASDGTVLEEVSILAAIEDSRYATSLISAMDQSGDIMHTNTIEVLDGSLDREGSPFAPGDVLISIREIDTIAVVDMEREQVVWALRGPWVQQHQPTALDNGNMLVFDNLGDEGWSRVVEFDPFTQEVAWSYRGSVRGFRSKTIGSNIRLPNGNTLITESDNGRAFEVTPGKEIVWEYHTPHRAGTEDQYVATLFEVVRLRADFPTHWIEGSDGKP